MAILNTPSPTPTSLFGRFKTLLKFTWSFIWMQLYFELLWTPLIIIILFRILLAIIFRTFYRGRYKLMCQNDAMFSANSFANMNNLTSFTFVKGNCDINLIRERVVKRFINYEDKGHRPYQRFLRGAVKKFGFFCWEDMSKSFDIFDHVRFCPGADDPNYVYSEAEMFEAVERRVNDIWEKGRPNWEILVIPKVKSDSSNNVNYVMVLRFSHSYMDGISLAQFYRKCFFDDEPYKRFFDPINPALPKTSFCQKILFYIRVYFLGPHYFFQLLNIEEDHVYRQGKLQGMKFIGRTKLKMNRDMIRLIRKTLKVSTTALLNSLYCGAMHKVAKQKGLMIPNEICGAVTVANLPYPNNRPQNRFAFSIQPYPVGMSDPLKRLADIYKKSKNSVKLRNLIATWSNMMTVHGLFPAWFIERFSKKLKCSYIMTNTPGTEGAYTYNGDEVECIFGCPPVLNTMSHSVGIEAYNDVFTACFIAERTSVINYRDDMDDFVAAFEDSITFLEAHSKTVLAAKAIRFKKSEC
ncbi:unnamed protein product [Orchesella dallaii]|uniref:O-acyltransferase WSD1 C-terminal domain-containing protein n=1 Tax=Orchesella dallaii TaxID=48710 RepID=A0ABP1QAB8_9HEXA